MNVQHRVCILYKKVCQVIYGAKIRTRGTFQLRKEQYNQRYLSHINSLEVNKVSETNLRLPVWDFKYFVFIDKLSQATPCPTCERLFFNKLDT